MKQTLKQKIGTGIVWLGGLAGLVGLSGCESYNEYDALSLASTSAVNESQTPQQAMFFGLMSDYFKEQGNRYDRRLVAGQENNNQQKTNGINWCLIKNLDTGESEYLMNSSDEWLSHIHLENGPKKGYLVTEVKEGIQYRELWLERDEEAKAYFARDREKAPKEIQDVRKQN